MNSYLPSSAEIIITIIAIWSGLAITGFLYSRLRKYSIAISMAWITVIGSMFLVHILTISEGAGIRMLALITVLLLAMKGVVVIEAYKGRGRRLSLLKWLAFLAWFGMRPSIFESLGSKKLEGAGKLIGFGVIRLIIGMALIATAYLLKSAIHSDILIGALLLVGLSLSLHFGILNISAGFWRFFGVDARMIFKQPMLSTSLTEFWGKRWNVAFSEMTALAIYKPAKPLIGIQAATIVAFLFSGVLHEIAISVSVMAGFGLPMMYFFIHGALLVAESNSRGLHRALQYKTFGRAWVWFWLIVPIPLLFHSYFMNGIIYPIINYHP